MGESKVSRGEIVVMVEKLATAMGAALRDTQTTVTRAIEDLAKRVVVLERRHNTDLVLHAQICEQCKQAIQAYGNPHAEGPLCPDGELLVKKWAAK
jgi:hypothetical protein